MKETVSLVSTELLESLKHSPIHVVAVGFSVTTNTILNYKYTTPIDGLKWQIVSKLKKYNNDLNEKQK